MPDVLASSHEAVVLFAKAPGARLAMLCAVHETIRVKSAAWDDTGVLVYTTLNHIKYCLPNGDSGIIRTLEVPVYITRVSGSSLHCLDRDGKTRQIQVTPCLCAAAAADAAAAVPAAADVLAAAAAVATATAWLPDTEVLTFDAAWLPDIHCIQSMM